MAKVRYALLFVTKRGNQIRYWATTPEKALRVFRQYHPKRRCLSRRPRRRAR